jgi:hypothetical protein
MSAIQLATTDARRAVAKVPQVPLRNRFVEPNGVLNDEGFSFIARPALKKFINVGTGPIRGIFDAPGVFNGDLFVVSGEDFFRVRSSDGVAQFIGPIGSNDSSVSWAATAPIGSEPGYLFFAEGNVLWLYQESAKATGGLTASAIANNDEVRIGDVYYRFTNASVDAGTPAGTSANPWLVALGTDLENSIINLAAAIMANGTAGTQYSTALIRHPDVDVTGFSPTTLAIQAIVEGPLGNVIVTTETGSGMSWGAGTLTGGGPPPLSQVPTPNSVGVISVAHINSYVIVVPVQSEADTTVGQFWWIEPGETTIDPLNFATAERSPDKIFQVLVYGDLFWLCGQNTVEPWQTTGNLAAPVQRYPGILYDRGSFEGTAVQVKDSVIIVDEDGGVFQLKGGANRISTPAVEELIRRQIQFLAVQEG